MRKMNWLIGSVALGLGMVIGILSYAVATTSAGGNSLLTKLWGGKDAQAVTSAVTASTSTSPVNTVNPADPANLQDSAHQQNSANAAEPANSAGASDSTGSNGLTGDSNFPSSASGETLSEGTANPGSINSGTTDPEKGTASQASQNKVPDELAQKIISDYKQDIGLFFGAWKSPDMVTFRTKLAKAYVGDLYEKHARQAEDFIVQGIGLEVSDIRFDEVTVESATSNAATLVAKYRYVAQDYNLGEQTAMGEKKEHLVNVRVNLIQMNSHWVITGETSLS